MMESGKETMQPAGMPEQNRFFLSEVSDTHIMHGLGVTLKPVFFQMV